MTLVFTDSAKGVKGGNQGGGGRGEGVEACDRSCCLCIYSRGKRICSVSAYWGGPGHDFWLAINTQKYWVLSAAGYMGSYSSDPPSPSLSCYPTSVWKLLLITGRGLKAEKWFLACGSHLTKQLMRLLNWLSLHRYSPIYIHILIVNSCATCINKPPWPIILP